MDQIKVELQEFMGGDKSIAEAAWTSSLDYQKKQTRSEEDVKRVVNMLADLKHSVPFESVVLRFWIKMPISTDRQHMTHRIASHSGMSGRYRTMPAEWQKVPEDVFDALQPCDTELYKAVAYGYETLCFEANRWYQDVVKMLKEAEGRTQITNAQMKRCREFFRNVLPQGNMTERITVMNLRSFANYQKLRNSDHAQPEIRSVAQQMLQQVKDKAVCPIALEALVRNEWSI